MGQDFRYALFLKEYSTHLFLKKKGATRNFWSTDFLS